jgi:uncharacterized protein with HEPN domain
MAGMRDVLIHHYSGVKWDVVWQTVQADLPDLQEMLVAVLADAPTVQDHGEDNAVT